MVSHASSRLTVLLTAMLSAAILPAAVVVETPTQDTFVDEGDFSEFAPNGSDLFLEIGRFSIFYAAKALIQFDLSAIPMGSTVNAASLQLFGGDPAWPENADTLSVFPITESWDESTIVFAPATGTPAATVNSTANPVFSITTLVQGWVDGTTPNFGVLIDNDSNPNVSGIFHSSDTVSGTMPSLTIDFVAIPEPSSGALLGLVVMSWLVRRRRV